MNREIEQAILTEGYRFCRVQPENIGVFSSAGKTCRFSGRLSGLSCGIAYTAVW